MSDKVCPLCRGDVAVGAVACRHCGARLSRTRAEVMATAVSALTREFQMTIGPVTECTAFCLSRHQHGSPGLQQCLDDCKAAEAIAAVAEWMHRELPKTFMEVIWSKGNIDPVPELAKQILDRFATAARAHLSHL